MAVMEYNAEGTYTLDSNLYYLATIGTELVNLTVNTGAGVILYGQDQVSLVGNGGFAYGSYVPDDQSQNVVNLIGSGTAYYGTIAATTVHATGNGSKIYGTNQDGSVVTLDGANELYAGAEGKATINLTLKDTANSIIAGGLRGDTLNLTASTGDTSPVVVDVGKSTSSGLNGVTFSNIANFGYTIARLGNPFTSRASTQFTTESGTNTFGLNLSSATNTVFNTGGNDTVTGGFGTDIIVGGTGSTRLNTNSGTDYLYGGGVGSTNILQPTTGAGGTDRFYGGSGIDYFFGGAGTGNDYMYSTTGTDYFQGGGGNNVLVEGIHSDEFHGTVGSDYIYGSSGASKVYGGSGTDFVYTGTQAQYFDSGSGKEYFEEMKGTQTNGKLDVVDNFQTAGANGKGTFVFLPNSEASSTSFVQGQGGVYIQTELGGGHVSDILVANTNNIAAVKAQTSFNL